MGQLVPLAAVNRGDVQESVHYGSVVVVDDTGRVIYSAGDPDFITFFRSASKPFQAIPLVAEGGIERFGLTSQELAIICGSHSGQPEHIQVVEQLLMKVGFIEGDLQCGIHPPSFFTANELTPEPGARFSQLHHNCSGKHTSMLALSKIYDEPKENYLDPNSRAQQAILQAVAEACRYPAVEIGVAIDGCSAPNFALPLRHMARGYANFVTAHGSTPASSRVYQTLRQAMLEHPLMVSGVGRFDYALMQAGRGQVLSKAGAEALECAALVDRGWGLAVKIADGSQRAVAPVVIEVLSQLGVPLDMSVPKLAEFARPVIKNYRGRVVGQIAPIFKLQAVKPARVREAVAV